MAFCSKCGAPLGENAKFCSGCGASIAPAPVPAAETVPVKRAVSFGQGVLMLFLFLADAALLLVILAGVLFKSL